MMTPLSRTNSSFSRIFLLAALCMLTIGMLFGLTGGLQYIIPLFLKEHLSFEKVRALHVSSVVFWIIIAAMGSVLTYLQEHTKKPLRFPMLVKVQFIIFITTIIAILISYILGMFGGREYWEFNPLFSIPLIAGWLLFIINWEPVALNDEQRISSF